MAWFETITDLTAAAETIRGRRYGVIETVDGRFEKLVFRPWPKLLSLADVVWMLGWQSRPATGNRCWLYFNQPLRHSNFLALKYVVSTQDCTLATFRKSLTVLDEIARIKKTDALLTDAANWRISDRLATRWGWEPHCPSRWHRNFIKRFYGVYPGAVEVSETEQPKRRPALVTFSMPGAENRTGSVC
ncbi:MAG: hypothetical protein K8T91_26365 [Planctomycetes bacterium]|nr:hypothetical protein [Planctomycetota bacterium]